MYANEIAIPATPVSSVVTETEPADGAERKIRLCIALTPVMWTTQKLSYALQVTLGPYSWILVLMNPAGPFLANMYSQSPLWVYLVIGVLRSTILMPTSYWQGRYMRDYLRIKVERMESRDQAVLAHPRWYHRYIAFYRRICDWVAGLIVPTRLFQRISKWVKRPPKKRADGKDASWFKRNFPKYGPLFIFIRPNGWNLIAAGATRMNPWVAGVSAVSGTVAWLVAVAFMGQYIPHVVLFVFSIF